MNVRIDLLCLFSIENVSFFLHTRNVRGGPKILSPTILPKKQMGHLCLYPPTSLFSPTSTLFCPRPTVQITIRPSIPSTVTTLNLRVVSGVYRSPLKHKSKRHTIHDIERGNGGGLLKLFSK